MNVNSPKKHAQPSNLEKMFNMVEKIFEKVQKLESHPLLKSPQPSPKKDDQEVMEILPFKDLSTHKKDTSKNNKAQRKRFSAKERLNIAIAAANARNNTKVASEYGITEGAVRKCLKDFSSKEDFLSALGKRKTPFRRPKYEELEERLKEWIGAQRLKKLSVSMKYIREKALDIYNEMYPDKNGEFTASRGWFWHFVKRANLSRRSPDLFPTLKTLFSLWR